MSLIINFVLLSRTFIHNTVKLSKEAKTAIIILIGLACFIFGISYIKSSSLFSSNKDYYAIFSHSAGLQSGTNVTANGVGIGTVKSVVIDPKTAQVVVTFSIKKDFTFSKNTVAEIYSSLVGNTSLQLLPAMDGAALAQAGDTLTSHIQTSLMDAIGANIEPTIGNLNKALTAADSLIGNVSNTLDAKTQQDIKESLANLNLTLQQMTKASANLNNLLSASSAPLQKSLANMQTVSGNFVQLSDSLSKLQIGRLMEQVEGTLSKVNGLLAQVEKGGGTVSKLLTDPKLYNNLQTATSELGLLMEDLRLNPKRYVHISVFGKNNQAYETPKKVETPISERN